MSATPQTSALTETGQFPYSHLFAPLRVATTASRLRSKTSDIDNSLSNRSLTTLHRQFLRQALSPRSAALEPTNRDRRHRRRQRWAILASLVTPAFARVKLASQAAILAPSAS